MDSETMLGIHMFGDVQACEQEIAPSKQVQTCGECGSDFVGAGFPIGTEGCWISNPNCGNCYGHVNGVYQGLDNQQLDNLEGLSSKEFADAMLFEAYGAYAFNRELTGSDPYADLIKLIENRHGDWAYRILDRFTVQALWSLADEHGAHNALELIENQVNSENI